MNTLLEDLDDRAGFAERVEGDAHSSAADATHAALTLERCRRLHDSELRCQRLCLLLRMRQDDPKASSGVDEAAVNLVTALNVELGFLEREAENAPPVLVARIAILRAMAERCLEAARRLLG